MDTIHVKYETEEFYYFLSKFINLCFHNSYFPSAITKGIITTLVKDRLRDITFIKNYKPIIISTTFFENFRII